jgi:hypothetical protein
MMQCISSLFIRLHAFEIADVVVAQNVIATVTSVSIMKV